MVARVIAQPAVVDLAQDVLGPLRCGVAAIWFNWKRAPVPPELAAQVIERLTDLPGLIDAGAPPAV